MNLKEKDGLVTLTKEDFELFQKQIRLYEDWIAEKNEMLRKKDAQISELRAIISKINFISRI